MTLLENMPGQKARLLRIFYSPVVSAIRLKTKELSASSLMTGNPVSPFPTWAVERLSIRTAFFYGNVRFGSRELDFRAEGSKIKACLKVCIPRPLLLLGP